MNAATLILIGALPSFAAGWFFRDLYDLKSKGDKAMIRAVLRPFSAVFTWFSHGNRLTGLVVATAMLAVAALGYGFVNDRSQASDRGRFYSCIGRYVSETSAAQAPRTAASVAANDARRDWDFAPESKKAAAKAHYRTLYATYVKVREGNPLPQFSRTYCDETEPK